MMNRLGTRIITSTSPRTFVRTTDILCNLPSPLCCTKTKTKLVNLPEESIAFCLSLCCCCCCDSPDVLWSTCPHTCPPSFPSLPRGEVAPLPPSSSSWPPGFLQKDCCTDEENRSNFHIFYSGDRTIFPTRTHPTAPVTTLQIRTRSPPTLRNLTKISSFGIYTLRDATTSLDLVAVARLFCIRI